MVQKGLDSGRLSTILPLAWSLALQHACMQYLPNCNTSNFVLQNYDVNISHTLKLVHMIHGCWLQRAICFQPVVKLFLNLDNQIKFQPPLQLHQLINEMSVSVQCQKSEYPPGLGIKPPPKQRRTSWGQKLSFFHFPNVVACFRYSLLCWPFGGFTAICSR